MKDFRGRNKLWPRQLIWKMRTTGCNGTPCAMWHQLDALKMAHSSTPGKKGCHATWKLDLHAPTTYTGTSTKLPPVPNPLQRLYKGTGGSEQQWLSWVLTPADNGTIYKTASNIHTAVIAVQEQLEKVPHLVPRESLKSIQARRKPCGAPSTTKQ